ncbi:hypothetical protein [Papillibacter cinnamivorans]|uniref:hypothetical protein n=1 Tax=Papillibacter cinnamivorans TaxID=100176 RepID=UPI0009FFB2D1|nr:hypothetical protein [Papillibacter cinnamivorans]
MSPDLSGWSSFLAFLVVGAFFLSCFGVFVACVLRRSRAFVFRAVCCLFRSDGAGVGAIFASLGWVVGVFGAVVLVSSSSVGVWVSGFFTVGAFGSCAVVAFSVAFSVVSFVWFGFWFFGCLSAVVVFRAFLSFGLVFLGVFFFFGVGVSRVVCGIVVWVIFFWEFAVGVVAVVVGCSLIVA